MYKLVENHEVSDDVNNCQVPRFLFYVVTLCSSSLSQNNLAELAIKDYVDLLGRFVVDLC